MMIRASIQMIILYFKNIKFEQMANKQLNNLVKYYCNNGVKIRILLVIGERNGVNLNEIEHI